jgi:ATP-dependent RNA helicase DeaD
VQAVTAKRVAQFTEHLLATIAGQDLAFFEHMVAELQQTQGLTADRIAAALAYLVQQERPLQGFDPAADDEFVDEGGGSHARGGRDTRRERDSGSGRRKRVHPAVDTGMVRYRIEVGRNHGVMPRDIVGANANEAGVEYAYIGYIGLEADYSTVDLPEGMPKEIFQHLKKIRVRQRPLHISVEGDGTRAPQGGREAESRRPPGPVAGFDPLKRKKPAAADSRRAPKSGFKSGAARSDRAGPVRRKAGKDKK